MNRKNLILAIAACLLLTVNSCKKDDLNSDEVKACFTYSPSTVLAGDTISFTDCSQNATIYDWDFGDNGYSSQANVKHAFASPGIYHVLLEVIGPNGVDSVSKDITVQGLTAAQVVGVYNGNETCTVGTDTYGITVTSGTSGSFSLQFANVYNQQLTMLGTLQGYSFTMPNQNVGNGITGYGSGTFSGNTMTFTYYLNDGVSSNSCTFTGTK
jgi:PKD repeat protein